MMVSSYHGGTVSSGVINIKQDVTQDVKCQDKEIILSTGMSTVKEIQFAINILKKNTVE